MAILDVNWNPTAKQLRQFSLLLVVFLAALGWLFWKSQSPAWAITATTAAVVSGLIGILRPNLMRVVYVAWLAAAFPIGWLVSHLLLAAIYYLVITPIGVMMRICRYDPLQRRFDPQAETYWKPREDRRDSKRYFKQY
jgi:membrane protein YdbS with pleckstrin-like domain